MLESPETLNKFSQDNLVAQLELQKFAYSQIQRIVFNNRG